jgi:hypothetical protein
MEALKRILEQDFLHFNSFIVDIIGEMQTVIGIEMNVIFDTAAVFNIHLTDNLYVDVDFSFDKNLLKIKNNQVKVDRNIFAIQNDALINRQGSLNYDAMNVFEIDMIVDSPSKVSKDDYLTTYVQDVFGILKLDIALKHERYQSYTYRVYDENVLVYESEYKLINEFTGSIICGFRKPGKYKIDVAFVDWYGGNTIVGINEYFDIVSSEVVMKLLSYNHHTANQRFTSLSSLRTFDTTKHNVPFQYVASGFDINTFDQTAHLTS